MTRSTGRTVAVALGAGSIALLAIGAYHEVLGYWFTGTDTIPLIETSRARTLGEALSLFAEPLMAGTDFTERALFYRPIASLSYAVDYAIWGLDPFGYHLTDLLAHALAAALVVYLVEEVLSVLPIAMLAGGLFALHPLSVEVVPTPARRHDVLATLFALCALWLFVRAARHVLESSDPKPAKTTEPSAGSGHRLGVLLGGSALAYALALGSKELAIVVPALVGVWTLLRARAVDASLRGTIRGGAVLLGPYLIVTAGYAAIRLAVLGGIGGYDRSMGPLSTEAITVTTARYVLSLVYPIDVLDVAGRPSLQLIPTGLYLVAALTVLLVGLSVWRSFVNGSLRGHWLSPTGRLLTLAGIWFLLPLPLFARTGQYTVRSGYLSIVPVAIVLAVVLGTGFRAFRARLSASVETSAGPAPDAMTVVVVGLLCCSLVAGSALIQPYDEWERAGEVSEATMETISATVEGTPANATVEVSPVPHPRSARRLGATPHPQSITFIWGNTITAWLRLHGAIDERTVLLNGTTTLERVPESITARTEPRTDPDRIALLLDYYGPRSNRSTGHLRPDSARPIPTPAVPSVPEPGGPSDRLPYERHGRSGPELISHCGDRR